MQYSVCDLAKMVPSHLLRLLRMSLIMNQIFAHSEIQMSVGLHADLSWVKLHVLLLIGWRLIGYAHIQILRTLKDAQSNFFLDTLLYP